MDGNVIVFSTLEWTEKSADRFIRVFRGASKNVARPVFATINMEIAKLASENGFSPITIFVRNLSEINYSMLNITTSSLAISVINKTGIGFYKNVVNLSSYVIAELPGDPLVPQAIKDGKQCWILSTGKTYRGHLTS